MLKRIVCSKNCGGSMSSKMPVKSFGLQRREAGSGERGAVTKLAAWIPAFAGMMLFLAITTSAFAADVVRPVRLLVPFAPGGGADTLARIITPKLSESTGEQWIVDNRGG